MRLIVGVLAVIGVITLVTGEAIQVGGLTSVAIAILIGLVFLKVMFCRAAFGVVGRKTMRHASPFGRPASRRTPRSPSVDDRKADATEDFDRWHRIAHARDEVDGWVADAASDEDHSTPE